MEITTAEQLLTTAGLGRCELIRGELHKLIPPGFEHGKVASNLGAELKVHARKHALGTVVSEVGFQLETDPDTVRAPDAAFVRAGRDQSRRGYYPGAPDLAVEVLSPSDRPGYVREKVAEWLEFGTEAVWVVDPYARTVTTYGSGGSGSAVTLGEGDTLTGGDLLPGFELPVRELFE